MGAHEAAGGRLEPTGDRAVGDDAGDLRTREPLSRGRVLVAAMRIADEHGLEAVTMRAVAGSLGVEAMSLYHHVANKEALLDGLVELVVDECRDAAEAAALPDPSVDWRASVRARCLAARTVVLRHPWTPALIDTRTSPPAGVVRWIDDVLASFRAGGFSWSLAHSALHALGSRALGFTQELFEPASGDPDVEDDMAVLEAVAPTITAMLDEVVHDDQTEFEFGLDVVLEGLARRLDG